MLIENYKAVRTSKINHQKSALIYMIFAFVSLSGWLLTAYLSKTRIEAIQTQQSINASRADELESELSELATEIHEAIKIEDLLPAETTVATSTEALATSMRTLGKFTVYAYFQGPNGLKTATGVTCAEGITVAADFDVLAPGTRIYIDGVGERIVQDCGITGRKLDLYMVKESNCWQWGRQIREVWVIE